MEEIKAKLEELYKKAMPNSNIGLALDIIRELIVVQNAIDQKMIRKGEKT